MNYTFKGVEKQAKDKGLILEREGRKYILYHPFYSAFGESECSNLYECMTEIMSFDTKHYEGDKGRDSSEISCLT